MDTKSKKYKRAASAAVNPVDKQYYDMPKTSKNPIELVMRVKFQGIHHPICATCDHSIMSHGELNGQLMCWRCAEIKKVCLAGIVLDIKRIVREALGYGTESISGTSREDSSVSGNGSEGRD